MELDDLVYTYPDEAEANFQTKISAKKEFREVAATTTEPIPKRGALYKHQQMLQRYMRQYDKMLLTWETGTGKTCGITAVTEFFRKLPDSPYNRVYYFVKGRNLKKEFEYQLACRCTTNYEEAAGPGGNILNEIRKYYTVTTFGGILDLTMDRVGRAVTGKQKIIRKNKPDEEITELYSGSIFIVDEVHNLRIDPKNSADYTEAQLEEAVETKPKDQKETYTQLHRLLHLAKRSKIILMSATPMVNTPAELGPLMNLLLPLDNQIPRAFRWDQATLADIEPYLNGKVSYIRALDTGAVVEYQGQLMNAEYKIQDEIVQSQLVVYPSEMSEFQNRTYQMAVTNPATFAPQKQKRFGQTRKDVRPGAFASAQRQAANLVYPDGTTANVGFRKYFKQETQMKMVKEKLVSVPVANVYTPSKEMAAALANPESLRQMSAKFYNTIALCQQNPGNCWVYINFVEGSGIYALAAAFEANGFQRFKYNESVFKTETGEDINKGFCSREAVANDNRQITIPTKVNRFAILVPGNPQGQDSSILEAFNSYENRNGDIIKVIIGSPVTREGLNLKNVLNIHLMGPNWTRAADMQAKGRALRSVSHDDLIQDERNRLIALGKDPDKAKVMVNIYRHVAVSPDTDSIDLDMYKIGEDKDRRIKRIFRMLKQIDPTCQLNYGRNVRPDDVDGSAECDYDMCQYPCFDRQPEYLDTTSYDVLYSQRIISEIKMAIKSLFRTVFHLSFDILYERLYTKNKEYKHKFIDAAIEEIIVNREPIKDRYGYTSYLREDRGTLFLQRNFPMENPGELTEDFSLFTYTETLIGIQKMELGEYINLLGRGEQVGLIKELETLDPNSQEFNNIINDLTLDNQIRLLEQALYTRIIERKTNPMIEGIISMFNQSIHSQREPIMWINRTAQALAAPQKRGRKPKPGSKSRLKRIKVDELEVPAIDPNDGELIYFHQLHGQKVGLTSYAVTANFLKAEGLIRILKPSEEIGWRDTNQAEQLVYKAVLEKEIERILNIYDQKGIYGSIMSDGKFRIVDKTKAGVTKTTDRRKKIKGQDCKSLAIPIIYEIMWKIKEREPNTFELFDTPVDLSENELIAAVKKRKNIDKGNDRVEDFGLPKLKFFYNLINSRLTKAQLCPILRSTLESSNRLLKLKPD